MISNKGARVETEVIRFYIKVVKLRFMIVRPRGVDEKGLFPIIAQSVL